VALLQLTSQELTAALSRLTTAEQQELLQLLEILAREEAEQPRDDRPSIEQTFAAVRDEYATKSGDPARYAEADAAHAAAVRRISARLVKQRPRSDAPPTPAALWSEFQEVTAQARDAGAPPADEIVKPPAPAKLEPDPLERLKLASTRRGGIVPKDMLLDSVIGATEERQREERVQRAAATEVVDKLDGFRGIGPVNYPPSYPDA
jgi:hypothetical protein